MSNPELWNQFLESQSVTHANTQEARYRAQREAQIDEMLTNDLTQGQKQFVDELWHERAEMARRDTALAYRQGVSDCVWLLKKLGVLA